MHNKRIFIIIIFILNAFHVFPQSKVDRFFDTFSLKPIAFDSSFIETHTNDLLIRATSVYKYTSLRMKLSETNEYLTISSAPQINLGVGFNYRWLGLNFTFNFGFINPSLTSKYGKQDRLDCTFQLYQRKFIIDGIFQYYKGFYVKRSSLIDPDAPGHPTLPDLKLFNAGANFLYGVNYKKYSYQAAFINNEIQKKSAGSLLLGGNFLYQTFRGDTIVLNDDFPQFFNDSINLGALYFINFGALCGYGYTFVIAKNYYISFLATPGINLEVSDVLTDDKKASIDPLFKFTGRAAAGYNHKRFFVSLIYFIDGNFGSSPYGNAFYRSGNFRLNAGMRLDVHKKRYKYEE